METTFLPIDEQIERAFKVELINVIQDSGSIDAHTNDYIQENLRLKLQQFKLRLMHNKNYKSNITWSSFFDYFVNVLDNWVKS